MLFNHHGGFWFTSGITFLARITNGLPSQTSITFTGPPSIQPKSMHNIHIKYATPLDGALSIEYGSCNVELTKRSTSNHLVGKTYVGNHPNTKRHIDWEDNRPAKFVWLTPDDVKDGNCLLAYSGAILVGRSDPLRVTTQQKRRGAVFSEIVDAEGPWQSKTVGILGAGMSGLMSAMLLESVGFHNWTILKASGRLGGRVRTTYLNGTTPEQYQYQEMGPMRFPVSVTYPGTNETLEIQDHKMVFQLAETLNKMNGNDPALAIQFIEFINNSTNEPIGIGATRPDGTAYGQAEILANPSLALPPTSASFANQTTITDARIAYAQWPGYDKEAKEELATNVFKAHKKAVANGLLDFSEAQYLRYRLGLDLNATDLIDSTWDVYPSWAYEQFQFGATYFKTIDKGVNRLPLAFTPMVEGKVMFDTAVQEMEWNATTSKMAVKWRPGNPFDVEPSSMEFDYVIVTVPFSKVRLWKLPRFSSLLSRAIHTLAYGETCKVVLHYKTRFWEHLKFPILGGCGTSAIPGIGAVCYPSYKNNSTGPGALLASYSMNQEAISLSSMTEIEHVAHAQRAMIQMHGPVAAEEFTGAYDRLCWGSEKYVAGGWAQPQVLQQQLYLPAYFKTEMNTVFVGEHTSFTHAWIWSALESSVKGTAQLLLDMGLVDEAKQITTEWMARWISV